MNTTCDQRGVLLREEIDDMMSAPVIASRGVKETGNGQDRPARREECWKLLG